MGKKKRATTAAWRAATAASLPLPTITSPATPLVATIAFADLPDPNTANKPPPALTQQPNDSHARTACPAHPAPSIALHTTTETTHGIPAVQADVIRPPAVVVEPYAHHAATTDEPREPCSPNARQTPHTASPTSNTDAPTPYDVPVAPGNIVPPRAAGNEIENKVGARREGLDGAHGEYIPLALRGTSSVQYTHLAPPTASPAPHIRTATPHHVLASPSSTTHPRAAENESGGLVGAHEDDPHALHARPMPHVPYLAQHALPTASHDVSAPKHNVSRPPTPGIEPGEPRMAAAYEPPVPEPTFVDRALHNDIVATAIQKGYEAGLKAGRNSGFREGLAARTKAGQSARREEDSSESTKQSSPEASTRASLAMSIDEIDADLLARVRKEAEYGVWEEGLEAGMTMGRKEGREAGYSEGLEAGRKMGMMEGRERGFEDGKSAGVQAGRVLERVEVRRIARPSVHVQTNNQPVRTYADAAVRTSESPPTQRADTAMQTLPLYAAAMPLIEDPDPALLDPTHLKEIVVTALSDGHAMGLKEGRNVGLQEGIATGRKVGTIEGREHGFDEGKSAGVKVGRELERAEVRRMARMSHLVQTDDPPMPVHLDTAVRIPDPLHTTSTPTKGLSTSNNLAPFSWADDADSLPILTLPPLCSMPTRDFSALRSDSITQPFGSIQRRVQRSQRHRTSLLQPRRYRTPPSATSTWRSSIRPVQHGSSRAYRASDLDWERDPRLSELARVLQGLGWVHSLFSSGRVSEATRTSPDWKGAHGVGRQGLPPSRGWVSSGV